MALNSAVYCGVGRIFCKTLKQHPVIIRDTVRTGHFGWDTSLGRSVSNTKIFKVNLFCKFHQDTWMNLFVFFLEGLRVPPSCELVVGGEPQCWSEGSCLLFDDSFLHRAFHEGKKGLKLNLLLHLFIYSLKED